MPLAQKIVYPRNGYVPANYAKYFYLGAQNSGDLENLVPAGALGVKNAGFSDASCWAVPGYVQVGGSNSNFATIAQASADLNSFVNNSFILAMRIKKSAVAFPAAEQQLVASYQPGTLFGGYIGASRPDGAFRLYLNSTDNVTVSLTTAANVITNGAAAPEVTIVCIIPYDGGTGYIAVNGVETVSSSIAAIVGKSLTGGRAARIGASLAGVGADAHGIASLQMYTMPLSSSQLNRNLIYDWIQRNPHLAIPNWVFGL